MVLGRVAVPRALRVWLVVCSACAASAQAPDLATRAAAARDTGQIVSALRLYRQGVQEKPGWLEGWWFAGLLAYESGQFADGRQAFTEFTKRSPKAPAGWAYLGLCEYETGAYGSALDHLDRGFASRARLDPEVEQVARFHRALLLTRAGAFDRAREELKPFAERGIHDPALIIGLGLNALEMPALPQQVPAGQRGLVEMAGKTAYAGMAGDSQQVEAGFRSLLSEYDNAAGVHYLYATYLLDVRPEAVNAELRRELEVNPANARARAVLALRLARAGDAAAAVPLARKAAADSPRLGLAQYAYGVALTETGASNDAIGYLQAAVRIDPGNLGYHTALATAYSDAGRYQDAYRERRASIKLARESGGPG
jgi:tetratricopeptide (TPR) repeat protein